MEKVEKTLPPALKPHILVVDDDDRLRKLLGLFLRENNFIVSTSASAANARAKLQSLSYDIIVLDVMMPDETGLELAQYLRKNPAFKDLPILLLTARSDVKERIEGLEAGADDYLSKPFEPRELLLRLHAILRRAQKGNSEEEPTLKLGRWKYNPERDELSCSEETLRLTDMEAGLMRILAANPGDVVSREILAESNKAIVNDRTIDVQVTRLRRKIEQDPRNPRYLVTVRGEGYRLIPDI
ncbi:MAG TPA: DNA-binding response regulator [Rhodospirillaceae bacterium]|nr:DNA-binding response regulator [Rhodospirillaceae bacterium]